MNNIIKYVEKKERKKHDRTQQYRRGHFDLFPFIGVQHHEVV